MITIDISPGEAIDRLTILEIKSEMISDSSKLKDIQSEINHLKPLISGFFEQCINFYAQLYFINKKIWDASEIIKKDTVGVEINTNLEYRKALVEVHTLNDNRFRVKSSINNFLKSDIKEHKNYANIDNEIVVSDDNVIYYISGGLLGDFLNLLFVVKTKYEETGKKGIIRIANFRCQIYFRYPLIQTFTELVPIIACQEYIEGFIYEKGDDVDEIDTIAKKKHINLSGWYSNFKPNKHVLLGETHWLDIFKDFFCLQKIPTPIKWLTYDKINKEFENKIVIFIKSGLSTEYELLKNIVTKNECIFVSFHIDDYNGFVYRDYVKKCVIIDNLSSLFSVINSCKFFIGSQSSPLAIAFAMEKPCYCDLYIIGTDRRHYMGMEKYHPNFFWGNSTGLARVDGIEKFLLI